MVGQCYLSQEDLEVVKYTYTSAATAWTPIYVAGIGVLVPQASYGANVEGSYFKKGVFKFAITSGVTVSVGNNVYLDTVAGTVQLTKPTAGFHVGTAVSGGTGVAALTVYASVELNTFNSGNGDFRDLDISTTGKLISECDATAISGAGSGTTTLTTEQTLGRLLLVDAGGGAINLATATAAAIVAALNNPKVGTAFDLAIRNTSDGNETITLTAGSGVTISGTATIAQNNTKRFLVRLDNVTASTEAVTVYSLGTSVH